MRSPSPPGWRNHPCPAGLKFRPWTRSSTALCSITLIRQASPFIPPSELGSCRTLSRRRRPHQLPGSPRDQSHQPVVERQRHHRNRMKRPGIPAGMPECSNCMGNCPVVNGPDSRGAAEGTDGRLHGQSRAPKAPPTSTKPRTLATLRDTLLPKLLSGRLRFRSTDRNCWKRDFPAKDHLRKPNHQYPERP